ncbi:MAG: monovalent cation/H(+) antiporter subunit G [Pirellulales bacterium]|nr:monovalent cation/H(+) antiporter subunit G [Pirellulales bacterium]
MMLFVLALATIAILTLLVAALGVVRLPDALSRQHAVTKAATLAVAIFALALMLAATASGWGFGWTVRLIAIVLILLCVLPLASHALARAGLAEGQIAEREPS